jgi:hypothetical protein
LQAGFASSHFFLRLRQVKQPVRVRLILGFGLPLKASSEPPALPDTGELLDAMFHGSVKTQNNSEKEQLRHKQEAGKHHNVETE